MRRPVETEEQKLERFKANAIMGLWGVGLAGIAILAANVFINRSRKNDAYKKSLDEGAPESFATRLRMAFENDGWWGTDNKEVFDVFNEIQTNSVYKMVQQKYDAKYGRNLNSDLESELSTNELNRVRAMLSLKPDQ